MNHSVLRLTLRIFHYSQAYDNPTITSTSIPPEKRAKHIHQCGGVRRSKAFSTFRPGLSALLSLSPARLLASLYFSFTKYNVLRPAKFIGLKIILCVYQNDPLFLPSIGRTFYYAALA